MQPTSHSSWGSIFAMVATIGGIILPMVPVQYQIAAQAVVAAVGAAAVKLP